MLAKNTNKNHKNHRHPRHLRSIVFSTAQQKPAKIIFALMNRVICVPLYSPPSNKNLRKSHLP